ncbi:MAG: arginine repressor [Acidobacteriota bacterium]|jgi:transcriptional regulator of arginine metabolism
MQKEQRQNRILALISERRIKKQDELAALLSAEGHAVTQSSVSRDLIELGIVKVKGHYATPSSKKISSGVAPVSILPAGDTLLVVKCGVGMASAVCVRLDAANIEGVIGTIAGEDTIFIAIADKKNQRDVMKAVMNLF